MTKKVKYYLDETDQIKVDGRTLSRLYLAEPIEGVREQEGLNAYAIFGEDNARRRMGGYIESLDILSTKVSPIDTVAWVREDSKVYGDSKISAGVSIINSTVVDSKVNNYTVTSKVINSRVVNSNVDGVKNSTVLNSTCTRLVKDSTVTDSTLKVEAHNSKIENSKITGTKSSYIVNANLNDVHHHGGISGTFSNIQQGDIKVHPISFYDNHGYDTLLNLLEGPSGNFALSDYDIYGTRLLSDVLLEQGDINFDELYYHLTQVVDGYTVGQPATIEMLEDLQNGDVLADGDLDFGEELER